MKTFYELAFCHLRINKSILFIAFFLLVQNSFAQILGMDLLGGEDKVEIPFEEKHGFIIVSVKFNRTLPLEFIFDTGAEHTILFKRQFADLMGIEYSKRIRILGSDLSQELYALIARNLYMQIKNTADVRRDIVVLEENLSMLDESTGLDVDGIIGGSYFRGMVVKINYKRRKITIYNPAKFSPPTKNFEEHNITLIRNKPYFVTNTLLSNGVDLETNLLLDTGAALTFLLHSNSDSLLVTPENKISGYVGYGISGPIEGFLGKVSKLYFGSFEFNDILTSFQEIENIILDDKTLVRNGILGNLLLRRFEVIIDYQKRKLYLKPNKNYNKEFKYDRSGLVIFALGRDFKEFYVRAVIKGSPAEEADIRPGDVIKKIRWLKSKHWSLERLTRLLQKKEGKCIKMTVERDGVKIKKKFYLRDLLQKSGTETQKT